MASCSSEVTTGLSTVPSKKVTPGENVKSPSDLVAAAAPTAVAPSRNTKDSVKSSWRSRDPSTWNYHQKRIVQRKMYYADLDKEVPVHKKSDKVPHVPDLECHFWVLYHSFIPMIIHQAFVSFTGYKVHWAPMVLFYTIASAVNGIHQISAMRHMGHIYGFLDGEKQRDDVPDDHAFKTVISLGLTVIGRAAMMVGLTYKGQAPNTCNWLALPVEVVIYAIVLDFWFYWYHRLMHCTEDLWKFHRTHHLVKRPTALLTLYADSEQEVFDIVGIPLLAFITMKLIGFPMGFYEWWVCQMYTIWVELVGHSGLRVHGGAITVNWFMRYFDMDLIIEDHDLHHRVGWKNSHNYGKQTRLWDTIFGTTHARMESTRDNVDWNKAAKWPLY